jgi:hypothetical protein
LGSRPTRSSDSTGYSNASPIEEDRRREEVASRSQADVGARFESYLSSTTPAHRDYQLVLSNAGQARAEGVTVQLVGPIEGNAPDLMMSGHSFPIALDPDQEYQIAAAVVVGTPPRSPYCSGGRTGPAPTRRRST